MPSLAVKGEGFEVVDFNEIPPVECLCGGSQRALVDDDGSPSLHLVVIANEDKPHRHETGEIYYFLRCGSGAAMILDGQRYPVRSGMAVKIRSNVMHCADNGGELMKVLVYVATGHGSPEAKMSFD